MDHSEELLGSKDIDCVPIEWVELTIYVSNLVAAESAVFQARQARLMAKGDHTK